MDKHLIIRGQQRGPLPKFLLWLAPWVAILGIGLYAIYLCLVEGLNQTNMDNRFAFGLWIFLDLTVIALGAGAFFTGFLLYIMRKNELKAVINSAVVLGFVCYSGAVAVLAVDVGQPLRAWFTFWHPNVHSMLTEVTFCITCYLTVLLIEYIPILLKNRKLKKVPSFLLFEFELHKLVYVLAGVGDIPLVLPSGFPGRTVRRPAGQAVRVPGRVCHLAFDVLPVHSLGRRRRAEFHRAHNLARIQDHRQETCEALGAYSSRTYFRDADDRLRPVQGC